MALIIINCLLCFASETLQTLRSLPCHRSQQYANQASLVTSLRANSKWQRVLLGPLSTTVLCGVYTVSGNKEKGHRNAESDARSVTECKHKCKNKESCGHACCKRHLSVAVPPQTAQQKVVGAANGMPECKHTCSDKLACGHPCCKRHLSQEALASGCKQQFRPKLQLMTQGQRKEQRLKVSSDTQQVRRNTPRPQMGVRGRSLSSAADLHTRTTDTDLTFHFFAYDIESTGAEAATDMAFTAPQ